MKARDHPALHIYGTSAMDEAILNDPGPRSSVIPRDRSRITHIEMPVQADPRSVGGAPLENRTQSHQLFAVSFFSRIVRMFAQGLEIVLVYARFETIGLGHLPEPFDNVPLFSGDAGYLDDAGEIGGDLVRV
jgi:hypothetical protein